MTERERDVDRLADDEVDAAAELAGATLPDASARAEAPPEPPAIPEVVDVTDLDWDAVRRAADPAAVRARLRDVVARAEGMLDAELGLKLLFDTDRSGPDDRVIQVTSLENDRPLWFIGDVHGDLLALEAALAIARRDAGDVGPRIVLLGDLFDDGGYGAEVLVRVLELLAEDPKSFCLVLGNHDEALRFDGTRFTSTVTPSDFADWLNQRLDDEWVVRLARAAMRLFARAPRALFLPDGLLVTHGGFPLVDLHEELRAGLDWNDPRCVQDFTWTRLHARSRRKLPNRSSRGSQFGREDFADFCAVAAERGRPVTHMVRGHDHEEERYGIYPAYKENPVLTTVALSRKLPREPFGPFERVPTAARWVPGALPQVHRLHVPPEMIRELYADQAEATEGAVEVPVEPPAPAPLADAAPNADGVAGEASSERTTRAAGDDRAEEASS